MAVTEFTNAFLRTLLPTVPSGLDSVNLDAHAEEQLEKAGYIIGRMQRVLFHEPGIKDTNWSATAPVTGVDGVERRWVYLHYFKDGQPSINWLDPTSAGMRPRWMDLWSPIMTRQSSSETFSASSPNSS